jgi:hypothetical protein
MAVSKRQIAAKTKGRSRLTNGFVLPRSVDSRSQWARRFRDLLVLHTNDLGGPDLITAAEAAIVRRAATLIVALEQMEAKFALKGKAEPHDLECYQRAGNSMRRLLESVGLARRQRDITPTLDQYIRENYGTPSAESEAGSTE